MSPRIATHLHSWALPRLYRPVATAVLFLVSRSSAAQVSPAFTPPADSVLYASLLAAEDARAPGDSTVGPLVRDRKSVV